MQKSETLRNITITHSVTVIGKENISICGIRFKLRTLHGFRSFLWALTPTAKTCILCDWGRGIQSRPHPGARGPPHPGIKGPCLVEVTRPKRKTHRLAGQVQVQMEQGAWKAPEQWPPSDPGCPVCSGLLLLLLNGSGLGGTVARGSVRMGSLPCEQFAECSPVTKRSWE